MTDQPTGLRDRITEALDSLKGTVHHLAPKTQQAVQDAVMAALTAVPRTDQALSERIVVAAIRLGHPRWDADDLAASVLAELPAEPVVPVSSPPPNQTADRAAVLREEAALIRAHCPDHLDSQSAEGSWISCHCDVADDMERRAAEAQQPDSYEATTGHLITCLAVAGGTPDPDCSCAPKAPHYEVPDETRPLCACGRFWPCALADTQPPVHKGGNADDCPA